MTAKTQTTRTALDAYLEERTAALVLLARIQDALEAYDDAPSSPEEINWAHAGDMAVTEMELRKIADRMFEEGEYAPEKQ